MMHSKTIVAVAFFVLLALLTALAMFWSNTINQDQRQLESIVNTQIKRQLIFAMRDAAHKRAISLLRMVTLEDPFAIDEEYLRFRELAGNFISARDVLLAFYFSDFEKAAWADAKDTIRASEKLQNLTADLILERSPVEARKILFSEVMPAQDKVNAALTQFMDYVRNEFDTDLNGTSLNKKNTFNLILYLVGVIVVLGTLLIIYIYRKTGMYENMLTRQSRQIHWLYEHTSQTGLSADEQLKNMLQLGCYLLNTQIGKICKIDRELGTNTFYKTYSPGFEIPEGKTIPLEFTFCSLAVLKDEPLAIDNVKKTNLNVKTCSEFSKIESYIAANIIVDKDKWGTVTFSSFHPKSEAFSDTDKDLVRLIASWVGFLLEKKQIQKKLEENAMYAQYVQQSQAQFLENIARKSQPPLDTVVHTCEAIKDDIDAQDFKHLGAKINLVHASGMQALAMLNDLLVLSKFKDGGIDTYSTNFSMGEVAEAIRDTINPILLQNNNQLTMHITNGNAILYTDATRFRQIMYNLLSSAAYHTHNGLITITTKHEYMRQKGWLEMTVEDTGTGISEPLAELLNNRQEDQDTDVTKLISPATTGLLIAHHICLLLGGEINAQSKKAVGTTIIVRLPIVVSDGLPSIESIAR